MLVLHCLLHLYATLDIKVKRNNFTCFQMCFYGPKWLPITKTAHSSAFLSFSFPGENSAMLNKENRENIGLCVFLDLLHNVWKQ